MVLYQLEYQKRIWFPSGSRRISAPAVPVQHARAQLQGDRGAEPDLPMGKQPGGNREAVGKFEVGRDPPRPRAPTPSARHGSQQGAGTQREFTISACACFPSLGPFANRIRTTMAV